MKTLKLSLLILSAAFLASCSHMSGTYINSGGLGGKITFVSGSKAQVEMMGATTECTYEKNGDQIKLINGDKNQILTIDKNGCLDGGELMGKYCKQ